MRVPGAAHPAPLQRFDVGARPVQQKPRGRVLETVPRRVTDAQPEHRGGVVRKTPRDGGACKVVHPAAGGGACVRCAGTRSIDRHHRVPQKTADFGVQRNRRLDADSGFAVCSPQYHISCSVMDKNHPYSRCLSRVAIGAALPQADASTGRRRVWAHHTPFEHVLLLVFEMASASSHQLSAALSAARRALRASYCSVAWPSPWRHSHCASLSPENCLHRLASTNLGAGRFQR